MVFGSNETIKQAVMAGLGVAFISAHTVAAEVAQRRIVVLPVTGLPVVRKWYLLRAKAKHLLPAGTALWGFLAKHGGRFPPDVSALVRRPKSRAVGGKHSTERNLVPHRADVTAVSRNDRFEGVGQPSPGPSISRSFESR
jgi:hypothetical protein